MSTLMFTLGIALWLLATWAFVLWGVERLRVSQILRVMPLKDRVIWLRKHKIQAGLLCVLRGFQILYIWRVCHTLSPRLGHTLGIVLVGYQILVIGVILFGVKKSLPKDLSINAGGTYHTGRWIAAWPNGNCYKGLILTRGEVREGYVVSRADDQQKGEHVTVGWLPQPVGLAVWVMNIVVIAISGLTLFSVL